MSDEVTKQDLGEVHKRIDDLGDKVNNGFLTLTTEVTRIATLMEERNQPRPINFVQQRLIHAGIMILQMGVVGLFLFWLNHAATHH